MYGGASRSIALVANSIQRSACDTGPVRVLFWPEGLMGHLPFLSNVYSEYFGATPRNRRMKVRGTQEN